MESNFVFYIHSDILDYLYCQNDIVLIKSFFEKTTPLIEVGKQINAKIFYSKESINNLNDYFKIFPQEFSPSIPDRLFDLLTDCKEISNGLFCFHVLFAQKNTQIQHSDFHYLDSLSLKSQNIIFSLYKNEEIDLLQIESNSIFNSVRVQVFNDPKSIWSFIQGNIPTRNYNFSSKHGNKHTIAIPPNGEDVSQLRCTDMEAQVLLNTAIFDLREKKFHYNFDLTENTYIVFPCEGINPQNQYHAYHLDNDTDIWEKEVPKSIRKFYNK